MRNRTQLLALALLLFSVPACKSEQPSGGDASASPTGASSGAAASGQKKEKTTCADWGGTGAFPDRCTLKGPSPVKGKWTGKYVDSFGREVPELEIENGFDLELMWGFVNLYYYDKDGKQLEITYENGSKAKRFYQNGSGLLQNIKPGEKKKLALGPTKKETPEGTDTIEVEVTGFGFELPNRDPKNKFFDVEIANYDERPKGGWK